MGFTENDRWPIRPTFLSLVKGSKEETANFNTDGIYYADYIRGFLADLSHDHDVRNALSMFQFVPSDFTPLDNNAEDDIKNIPKRNATVLLNAPVDYRIREILDGRLIIRIDSGTFINNGVCCDRFRGCSHKNVNFCYEQDSRVGIFASPLLDDLQYNSDSYKVVLNNIIDEFNAKEESDLSKLKIEEFEGRLYVHYTCPMSLFEEHIFPIYAKGRIIACLMLGQMARDAYRVDGSFKECQIIMGCSKENCKALNEGLNVENLSDIEWNKKLHAIIDRINIFEKRLEDKINHRSTTYIEDQFREIKQRFNTRIKGIRIRDNSIGEVFYGVLSRALTEIHNIFNGRTGGFIRMFALPMDNGSDNYVPIGWSETDLESKNYPQVTKNYFFSVKGLEAAKISMMGEPFALDSAQIEKILTNAASRDIVKQFDCKKDTLGVKKLLADGISFIVWKRHTNKKAINDKKAFEAYKNALMTFYTIAFQCYSYIRGTKLEYVLETTIRTTAHESAHFILPALGIVENKLQMVPEEMVLSGYAKEYEKFRTSQIHYKENVYELLKQLSEINTRPSIIFKNIIVEKEPTQVFYLLYKMKKMMESKAQDSHHQIVYNQINNYVDVCVDTTYFNHALFNLVDNAIKYGYEGSYIYINMTNNTEFLEVKIISYGGQIEDGDRIYRLFERGFDYANVAGMGIGMFIVKKICEAHDGSIAHRSEKVCELNLPVLACYGIHRNPFLLHELEDSMKDFVHVEISKMNKNLISEVVCDSTFVKYPNVFKSRISSPTFRNTFVVTIPIK